MLRKYIPPAVKQLIKTTLHFGNKYQCPICGFKARDLAPIGMDIPVFKEKKVIGGGRRKGGCYKCNSRERDRMIYLYLKDKLKIFDSSKDLKILHLAPEIGLSKALLKIGYDTYICGDLFVEGYFYPKYVQNINVLDIPFDSNYFDLIICNHMLEHIPNDTDAMKELFRVLKLGGQAILQVPISQTMETTFEDFTIKDPKERELVFGQSDHVRIYGQDYTDRLQSVGFKTEKINIFKEYAQRNYGLDPNEDLIVGKK